MIIDPNAEQKKPKIPWRTVNEYNIGDNYGPGEQIKVRCKDPRGVYYNHLRRREGDVFMLIPQYVTVVDMKTGKVVMENGEPKKNLVSAQDQFSETTMELVEEATPETITTAKEALNKVTEELTQGKAPARAR